MRNPFPILFLLAGCLATAYTHAGSLYDYEPYSENRLEQLQSEGAPILVEVRTDWCTTCEAQRKALGSILDQPHLSDIRVLRLDFDDQKAEAEALGASRQSTLILFGGERELDRSMAETNPGRLEDFLAQALACD